MINVWRVANVHARERNNATVPGLYRVETDVASAVGKGIRVAATSVCGNIYVCNVLLCYITSWFLSFSFVILF